MQGILAGIDANGVCDCSGGLMGHNDVLHVLLSPRSSSERFWAGARPVHPILGHSRRVYFSCAHLCGTQRPQVALVLFSLVRTMRLPSYMLTVKHQG